MLKFYCSSLFLLFTHAFYSQANPCNSIDEKYEKKFIKALSEKNPVKQLEKLSKVAVDFPKQAKTYFYLANITNRDAQTLSFQGKQKEARDQQKKATLYYQATIKKCASFHASCYYNIAENLISVGEQESAIPFLKKYIEFPEDDFEKLEEDFVSRKRSALALLDELEFEKNLFNNPVPFHPSKIKNVSTQLDEYFPMISPDNDLLFFSRKVDRKNFGDMSENIREELTLSTKDEESLEFDYGNPLPAPFNDGSFLNYGTTSLSVDNKEMIICACKKEIFNKQYYLNCDLYSTNFTRKGYGGNDFEWSKLKNLGPNINTPDGWEAQPTLSSDGKLLFFTALRNNTRDNDIFVSERLPDGSWSKAVPFDLINTSGKDKSPFFHQDGETLYFVSSTSASRKGVGGLDIFYIRRDGGGWTKPKNIGYPINSIDDELGIFISSNGEVAYFSSVKEGEWNIYSFDLYKEARPKEVVIVKGELKNEDGTPVKDAVIDVSYNDNGETHQFKVNGDDGKFAAVIKVDKKQDVTISILKDNYAFQAKVIEKDSFDVVKESKMKLGEFVLEKIEANKSYRLSDIYFSTESYELNDKSKALLNSFASYLLKNPSLQVGINGHTDDVGEASANEILSQNRADAVRNYLIHRGIEPEKLVSVGYGEINPKVPNNSERNRALNRRTEFQFIQH
ncbi:MAG: OmpA family protein [Bacteroidetes bacterium]|nr:OmpA family protein [Bacteroidota bacterium]